MSSIKTVLFIIMAIAASRAYSLENINKKTLWTIAWSPNGKYIATGGDQGELKIFDGKTFELLNTYPVKDVILSRVKWHPIQNKLAIITQSETVKARILDIDQEIWIDLEGLQSSFRGLDWNHTGEFLAVSELEGAVSVFNEEGKLISRFEADPKGAAGLDWHPTKNILTTVGSQIGSFSHLGDTLQIFQPRSEEAFLLCIEWHNSEIFFAVGDYGDLEYARNKLIQFWTIDGEKLNEIPGGLVEYRNIRWSPDGERLASASDALRIWSKEGELLAESNSSEDYLWGVDWSPDGTTIITSSYFGTITIWDSRANLIKKLEY